MKSSGEVGSYLK